MEKSTIIGGVLHLWQMGDYPIAIVIFLASVAVPIAKFVILFYLLLEIASKHRSDPKKLAILYHVVEVSGPWSLVDVFVVVILAAVVHFVSVSIIPGLGATSFALMVFFTLLASRSLKICLAGAQCEI
jgi:paraquat-inducible protein A